MSRYPRPASRGQLLTAAVVLTFAIGCGAEMPGEPAPAASAPVPALSPGASVRGELVSYILTLHDGRTDEQLFLRLPGAAGEERRLHFDSLPDIAGGATIDIWPRSITAAGEIFVDRLKVVDEGRAVELRQSALINGQAYRPRKIAFVLVDLGDGVNITKEMANQRINGTATGDRSLRQYYIEASYGRQDIGGDIIGPIRGTMAGCNFQALAQQLRPMVQGQYDHYFWYFGRPRPSSVCPFLGVASSGSPDRPSRDTWYNGSTTCVVLVQEPGHNFGMMHSSTMRCRTDGQPSTFNDTPQGNCTHSEYGDPYDPMGRACRHMNGYHKAFQGWFGKCNMVEVKASGTFTVNPIELPCDGVQVLQIPMPKSRSFNRSGGGGPSGPTVLTHYYVELRAPHGFDQINPPIAPTVQVRASGDIRMRNQRGFHTWVMDMNPATTNAIEGLATGGTFTDPMGGIKITVESLDAQKASVKVEIPGGTGAPVCLDGTDFTAPGPGIESCAMAPASPSGAPPSFSDGGVTPNPTGDAGMQAPRDAGPESGAGGSGGTGAGGAGGSGIDNPNPGVGGSGPMADASSGTGGRAGLGGSGAARDSGAAGSGPSTSNTGQAVSGSGCGCRVGGTERSGGSASIALLLGLGLLLRLGRRRR